MSERERMRTRETKGKDTAREREPVSLWEHLTRFVADQSRPMDSSKALGGSGRRLGRPG